MSGVLTRELYMVLIYLFSTIWTLFMLIVMLSGTIFWAFMQVDVIKRQFPKPE